jgi:hypothetical protein
MLKLTVFTMTAGNRPESLAKCKDSVQKALREGMEHKIIVGTDYINAKIEAVQTPGYICFVDDDDYIEPDSLELMMKAIDKTGAGSAIMWERIEDEKGMAITTNDSQRRYMDVVISPMACHHPVVFATKFVPPEALEVARKANVAVDWLIQGSAMLAGGAVQVPKVGYHWVSHPEQESKKEEFVDAHAKMHADVSKLLQQWNPERDLFKMIPQYKEVK